jgi:hypothetical protein
MSKIKFLIFIGLVVALAALAPVAALAQLPPYAAPGGVPHYFGPYGNWAFSPLPKGPVATITVVTVARIYWRAYSHHRRCLWNRFRRYG